MMDFENNQIITDELPRIEQVTYEPLKRNFLWMALTQNAIFLVVLFIIGLIVTLTAFLSAFFSTFLKVLGAWFVFSVVVMLLTWFGFRVKGFAVRQRDITYKSGLIFRSVISVPFNRVQHCEIRKGPFEELFDLAKLKVYTAGGMASDISIPGLDPARAESLKEFILMKTEEDEEE
ncbi:MAG: hypothetical protein EA409_02705 [Saprospirales bacterium]|nr:MAG: hypothetical protein EA409_02705 [Saprospirales bacterium]